MKLFKSLIVMIGLTLLFALAACSSGESSSTNDSSSDNQEESSNQENTSNEEDTAENPNKPEKLTLVDVGWESIQFQNALAKLVIEEGYDIKVDIIPGSTAAAMQGLENGDIDVDMEFWTDNVLEDYNAMLDSGEVVELGTTLDQNIQGIYVPTYMIEGDAERGIEPMTPDLVKLVDLPKYKDVFKDPEDPSKGRLVGSPAGWHVDVVLQQKMKTFGLEDTFNYFRPGSSAALTTSLATAYEAGEPWVGYYWEPTWVMGKYDMTLLEQPEYNEEDWNNGYATHYPSNRITIVANKSVTENAPGVAEFLRNFTFSTEEINKILMYMEDNEATADETAAWYAKEYEDVWTTWVPEDVAKKVKSAIE